MSETVRGGAGSAEGDVHGAGADVGAGRGAGGEGTVGAQACDSGGGADQCQGSDDFTGGGFQVETHDEIPFLWMGPPQRTAGPSGR